MVKTASTMMPLGTQAPDFSLVNVDGTTVSRNDFDEASALVVMFICNHCPFVKHIAYQLATIGRDYVPQGVGIVAINSNDTSKYPEDSPEQMVHEAESRGYMFPYLFDEDQAVAKAYRAACTPDFFVFDRDHKLVYRGQLDDCHPSNELEVTGNDLRAAIDAAVAGESMDEAQQTPSIGCNIKWIEGDEPGYFDPKGVS